MSSYHPLVLFQLYPSDDTRLTRTTCHHITGEDDEVGIFLGHDVHHETRGVDIVLERFTIVKIRELGVKGVWREEPAAHQTRHSL